MPKKLTTDQFIEKSNKIHNYKYDYSLVNYIKNNIKVEIICPIHGVFKQLPYAHLRGQGCKKCAKNTKRTSEEFIKLAIKKHGELYDYSFVNYINKKSLVKIKCEEHGIFEQRADLHLNGHGCKTCRKSKMEKYLMKKLKELNIEYITDKKYNDCRNKYPLPFDFYLIKYNILIECDGIQHHQSVEHFGGQERFEYQKNNDNIKTKYCEDNNIELIRVINISDIDSFLLKFYN